MKGHRVPQGSFNGEGPRPDDSGKPPRNRRIVLNSMTEWCLWKARHRVDPGHDTAPSPWGEGSTGAGPIPP
jgi:hypothetical protein